MLQRVGVVDVLPVRCVLYQDWTMPVILKDVYAAIRGDARAVLVNAQCPGGDLAGMTDLLDGFRLLARKKPLYFIANDEICSDMYWIASLGRQIAATPTAIVGSIGTRIGPFWDVSKNLQDQGISVSNIKSGELKDAGNYGVPFTDDARRMFQSVCDGVAETMFADVARGRRMTVQQVRDLQASIFTGPQGKNVGLVDTVTTLREYLEQINAAHATGGNGMPPMQIPEPGHQPADPADPADPEPDPQDAEASASGEAPMADATKNAPSNPEPKASAAAAPAPAAPVEQPATLAQLKEIHGGDADAVLASMEAGHTTLQATQAANAALRTALASKPAPDKHEPKGATPASVAQGGATGGPAGEFDQKIREYMVTNKTTRGEAFVACSTMYPELRRAYQSGAMKTRVEGPIEN